MDSGLRKDCVEIYRPIFEMLSKDANLKNILSEGIISINNNEVQVRGIDSVVPGFSNKTYKFLKDYISRVQS